ncbi:MAG: LptF/LptG family permease [Gemmataceae bacterium]
MHLLDRLLFRSYLKSYLFCFVILLTLYVIVDLFTNLDDFTSQNSKLLAVLKQIGTYYGYWVWLIFDRLSEVIVVLAAAFTVALMQRNNEMLPLLSAGVSTRRVVMPVLAAALAMLGLTIANQELIIPKIGQQLTYQKNDVYGEQQIPVIGDYEPNGVHLDGHFASRKDKVVRNFSLTIPDNIVGYIVHMTAREAYYIPPVAGEPLSGGWLMVGTQPERLQGWKHPVLEMIDPGKFFLHTRRVNFDQLTRHRKWYQYASTVKLREELNHPDSTRLAAMAVLFHFRLTRPILGMILVIMCLAVILRDQNRNVFISAGMCLVLCGMFFAAKFACQSLGDSEYLSPALAAWLPVFLFGPFSFVMFDSMHT